MSVVFVVSSVVLVIYVINLQKSIVNSTALDSAKTYSDALKEFRDIYTSEVVSTVMEHPDFNVSHNYQERSFNIPLPATLSMALGERISGQDTGAEVHLYSPYPFPWRKNEGLKDDFRQRAWDAVTKHKKTNYYEFLIYKGEPVLRFATPDIMQTSCVSCHNSHPSTPQTGWQIGDVRGVLEIIYPMNISESKAFNGIQGIIILASIIAGLGFIGLLFMLYRFSATTRYLEGCIQDRTQEIKAIEKKLAYSKKMTSIGEVSAGIAHEISQPIGAIKLSCETLKFALEKGAKDIILKQADRIKKQVDRADSIVRQLNVNNRLEKPELNNLSEIVENIVVNLNQQFIKEKILVNKKVQLDLSKVKCVKQELERVINNLLMNAIHAVRDEAEKNIEIKLSEADEKIYLSVADNGCGIPEVLVEKIFDPFFTTKEVGEGTGLGLSLSYSIIRALGGELTVKSEINIGSQFVVILPVCSDLENFNYSTDVG